MINACIKGIASYVWSRRKLILWVTKQRYFTFVSTLSETQVQRIQFSELRHISLLLTLFITYFIYYLLYLLLIFFCVIACAKGIFSGLWSEQGARSKLWVRETACKLDCPQSLFYLVPQESVNLTAKQDYFGKCIQFFITLLLFPCMQGISDFRLV